MGKCSIIMSILQENRIETATKVQEVLTNYGCIIRVRLGLHDAGISSCSNSGIILLQLCGDKHEVDEMEADLKKITNVKTKYMDLGF